MDHVQVMLGLPARVVALELAKVAYPLAVVAHPGIVAERPAEQAARDLLAKADRLDHGAR
jgi:hypothetical protein